MGLAVFATIAGLIAVIYAVYLIMKINTFDAGNERMKEISHAIQEGAMAFLKREYFFLVFLLSECLSSSLLPEELLKPFVIFVVRFVQY